jgi:hypothetical protein
MEHISKLRGLGFGRRCLIVGGGHSLNNFEWENISDDIYIICLNNHLNQMADMIIYFDKEMKRYFEKHTIGDDTVLVGHRKAEGSTIDSTVPRCNYWYNTINDVEFGDSGYMSLQMADQIFDFDEIFLIGYDYKVKDKSYHHNEMESEERKINGFIRTSILKVLPKYDTINWSNRIFNCNEESNLKSFEYKKPFKETIHVRDINGRAENN